MSPLPRPAVALLSLTIATLAAVSAEAPTGAAVSPILAPSDVFNLEYAYDPRLSPDGKQVVYVRSFADVMDDMNYGNLWSVDFDGGRHRALTTGDAHDGAPRWSPDGSRIAFLSDRDGSAQIWVRWMDTGQMARVTSMPSSPSAAAWSPDGRWLAFTALVPASPRTVGTMPAAPEGATWAPPARVIDALVYRFDGAGYLKSGHTHLFVVPAEGGTPRQISTGDFDHGGVGFAGATPVWARDGKSLLLAVNRRAEPMDAPLDSEIWEFPLEGGDPHALTDRRGPDSEPAVSPDGRLIAYTGFDDRYQGYQITRLYVMNRDGSESRILTADLDRSVSSPAWSEDGKRIYFLYDDEGDTRLAAITLDGAMEQVAHEVGSGYLAYSMGTSFTLGAGERLALTQTTPWRPGDIAVGRRGGDLRLVTGVNDELLDHRRLGRVEEIRYASSKDGRDIQGWVIYPPDFDPQQRYPLILEIHGGPFANYGPRWDVEKQLMAAAGNVVLYLNPRGSTSYGEEFGNLIHHAYPGDDFYDLNSGVDALLARGFIDPERLYVTGGSGGGVLTCWMIGRSDRFRAAASLYPVINWYSFVLTADASAFFVKYWFPGYPWDYPEHYNSRSLLSVVSHVKTPTMVLTGEEDYRTPMSESEQYYLALKLLKVDTVLVRVPGEAHGTAGRPSHLVSKLVNILGWFDEHGGTQGAAE